MSAELRDPFAEAEAYRKAGWRGTLRLPSGQKGPPPGGFTGADGRWPEADDLAAFRREGPGNIALRLPKFVLGIDVDDYGTKEGGTTLAALEAKLGPLPATWWTTSRADGVSGIRLYRVPHEIDQWPSGAGPDIELISRGHRYAVVWPSPHPEERTYGFRRPDGSWAADGELPRPGDLPELPAAWVEYLTGMKADGTHDPKHTKPGGRGERRRHARAVQAWLDALPKGEPCEYVGKLCAEALASARRENGSAHEAVLGDVFALLRAGERGHPGVPDVLDRVRAQFVDTVADNRGGGHVARAEFDRLTLNGVEKVLGDPDERAGHGCDCRELDGGSTRRDSEEPEGMPPATCALDAPEVEPPKWGVRGLVTQGDPGLIVGDGGVGKDTMALALAVAYATGQPAFGRFTVEDPGPVLYVSEEDPGPVLVNRLEALAKGAGADREEVLSRFHFIALAGVHLDAEAWQGHITAEAERVGARLIVLGPLRDLSTGEENTSDGMKAPLAYARRLAVRTGAAVALIHHAGKVVDGKRRLDRIRGSSHINTTPRWILFLDSAPEGILVSPLKLTHGVPHEPFVLRREIEVDREDGIRWTRASLRHVPRERAELTGAAEWILQLVEDSPGLNSTEIRKAGTKEGHKPNAISQAVKTLELRGSIEATAGARGAKQWSAASTLSTPPRRVEGGEPASVASDPEHAGSTEGPPDPASPSLEGRRAEATGKADTQGGGSTLQRMCRTCGTHVGPTVEQCAECKYGEASA